MTAAKTKPTKADGYVRVSTEGQATEGISLEAPQGPNRGSLRICFQRLLWPPASSVVGSRSRGSHVTRGPHGCGLRPSGSANCRQSLRSRRRPRSLHLACSAGPGVAETRGLNTRLEQPVTGRGSPPNPTPPITFSPRTSCTIARSRAR